MLCREDYRAAALLEQARAGDAVLSSRSMRGKNADAAGRGDGDDNDDNNFIFDSQDGGDRIFRKQVLGGETAEGDEPRWQLSLSEQNLQALSGAKNLCSA